MSAPLSWAARKTFLPIRPKPLIATRTAMHALFLFPPVSEAGGDAARSEPPGPATASLARRGLPEPPPPPATTSGSRENVCTETYAFRSAARHDLDAQPVGIGK